MSHTFILARRARDWVARALDEFGPDFRDMTPAQREILRAWQARRVQERRATRLRVITARAKARAQHAAQALPRVEDLEAPTGADPRADGLGTAASWSRVKSRGIPRHSPDPEGYAQRLALRDLGPRPPGRAHMRPPSEAERIQAATHAHWDALDVEAEKLLRSFEAQARPTLTAPARKMKWTRAG